MTSTPVADVSAYIANYTSAKATGSGTDAANNFNDVLKQQTDTKAEQPVSRSTRPRTEHAARETISAKESSVKPQRGSSLTKQDKLPEEEITQAVEEAAGQMLMQVAQELNLTMDEVEGMLEELDMQVTDLLNPENISALVLKATGNTDMMELLTNQEIYTSVQSLKETLQGIEENLLQQTGLSKEELVQVLERFAELTDGTEMQMPEMQTDLQAEADDSLMNAKPEEAENENETVINEAEVFDRQEPEIAVVRKVSAKGNEANARNAGAENTPFVINQNLVNETANTVVAAGETFTTHSTSQIMNQIMDYMNVTMQPDMTELEMQLHPESLGKVNVHISAKEGAITAQFTAQNETVKAAIESQMVQLKENFAQQGIKVDAVEVTVEYHGFNRSMDQSTQSGSGEQEGKKSRPRRLQLDALEGVEMEELAEEEQLAVRMMEQNGNTVDYTA